MKKINKVTILIFSLLLILGTSFSTFADTDDQSLVTIKSPSIEINVDDNGNVSFNEGKSESIEFAEQSLQRSTVTGNIGSASIKWINRSQINWRLTAHIARQFIIFTGGIEIEELDGTYVKDIPIAKSGPSPLSDNVFVSLPAGNYICTLYGYGTCNNLAFTVETVHDII